MISSISSFEIIVSASNQRIFLCIPVSTNNPNGIETLVANGLNTFFIKGKPAVFSNGPKSLPRIPPGCTI